MPGQPSRADPNSERILLEINQPASNHNGGMMQFGPDGYLYIGVGDGGGSGDPDDNSQDRKTLLGNILRIDVDSISDGLQYGIPPYNPFVGNTQDYREQIFAWGLRNPWRFSIDFETGEIWAGDVGQRRQEEIHLIEKGDNLGWNIMEGFECFNKNNFTNPLSSCDQNWVNSAYRRSWPKCGAFYYRRVYLSRPTAARACGGLRIRRFRDRHNLDAQI